MNTFLFSNAISYKSGVRIQPASIACLYLPGPVSVSFFLSIHHGQPLPSYPFASIPDALEPLLLYPIQAKLQSRHNPAPSPTLHLHLCRGMWLEKREQNTKTQLCHPLNDCEPYTPLPAQIQHFARSLSPSSIFFLLQEPPSLIPFPDVLASHFPEKDEMMGREIAQPPSFMCCLLTFHNMNFLSCFAKPGPLHLRTISALSCVL